MKITKVFWFILGIILLGIAYIGFIVPGIPWSTPAVGAAFCFAKSSDRMHRWIYNHKIFGPFLNNWKEKRIFPTKAKYLMVVTMLMSLIITWFTTKNIILILFVSILMIICIIWGWRYPGSEEEYERRVREGKKIAWLK
jgi:uncharacterized membrane protein YbaN (DUF454 family)